MNSRLFSRVLCAALFVLPATAYAQQSPAPAPSATPEIAHVTTSDRSDETLKNVSRTTYVVTKSEIVERGYRSVGEALASIPGVEIFQYGARGAAVSFGLRGSNSSQTVVLVDGMPAAGSFSNTANLAAFSTTGVERIEVVEGGGTTLYGSGAVGGVINIITQSQSAQPAAMLRLGSFGDRQLSVEGDGFGFERVQAQNAYGLPPNATLGTQRLYSDYSATTAHAGFDRALSAATTASVRASITGDQLGAPGSTSYYAPFSREKDLDANVQLGLAHRSARAQFTAQLGAARQSIDFGCTAPACSFVFSSVDTEGRTDLSLRDAVDEGGGRLLYGVDLARGVVHSDDGAGDAATNAVSQSAAYVQQTWQSHRGDRVYAGFRGERDASLGGQYSPSFGFTRVLGPDFTLKGNVARAFRAPNASELYFPFYGNPALRPERSSVGDLTLTDGAILGGASLGWFFNYSRDLIVPDLATFTAQNEAQGSIGGFTFALRTLPLNRFTTSLGITDLYRAQAFDASGATHRIPNDPVLNATLDLTYRGLPSGLLSDAGVRMRVVGKRGAVDTTLPLFDQPAAASRLDAYARFRLTRGALLTLRGANLGNERYAEIPGYPMPGRSFALELSTR